MRRLPILAAALTLLLVGGVAVAFPGHDPADGHSYFSLEIEHKCCNNNGLSTFEETYDSTRFEESQGWDFGDRYGYTCAWVEFFQGADEKFEVHYELIDYADAVPASDAVLINDTWGQEDESADKPGTSGALCGDGIQHNQQPVGPEDHFPHGDYFQTQGTPVADLVFFSGGQEIARIDYSQGSYCDSAYWTPGDEPGESILWWDPDGPSSPDGHATLNCDPATGPLPPHPVVYARVKNADPDVTYCVLDFPDRCAGAAFTPSPTTTTTVPTTTTTLPTTTTTVPVTTTPTVPPIPVITLPLGTTELRCPNGSRPRVVRTSPLRVAC
jgi:hypothetical protein